MRIVGLFVDENKETIIKLVNSNNWNRIEHYKVPGGWDRESEAIKYF